MSDKVKILRRSDRVRVIARVGERSRTKQSFKDECDVNKIMAQYAKTGVLEHVRRSEGSFADVASAPQYHDALNIMIEAQDLFEMLPAQMRKRFENDPGQLLSFLDDPENRPEAVKLGLVRPEDPQDPPPADPPPAPPAAPPEPPDGGSDQLPS